VLVTPLHIHHDDDEAWYVLEGRLRFRLGNDEVDAPAGSAVYAPRGTPHTYWNPGPVPARYILVMTENTHRLIEELHSGAARHLETMQAVFRRHNCEILDE
jgi:mannose-6-phosphate isomerase-like protein (cupin superfamily)